MPDRKPDLMQSQPDPSQLARFEKAAREHGCDDAESLRQFDAKLRRMLRRRPVVER